MRTARGTYRPTMRERARVKNTFLPHQSAKLTSGCFVKVYVHPLELQIRISGVGSSRVDAVFIANNLSQSIPRHDSPQSVILSQVSARVVLAALTRARYFHAPPKTWHRFGYHTAPLECAQFLCVRVRARRHFPSITGIAINRSNERGFDFSATKKRAIARLFDFRTPRPASPFIIAPRRLVSRTSSFTLRFSCRASSPFVRSFVRSCVVDIPVRRTVSICLPKLAHVTLPKKARDVAPHCYASTGRTERSTDEASPGSNGLRSGHVRANRFFTRARRRSRCSRESSVSSSWSDDASGCE
jgi:hypothetical protein